MIPISRPSVGWLEASAAAKTILSGWLTQGPEVEKFESEFAEFVEAQYACAVSNCTTALQLALTALDIGTDNEVITVSHSFIATANAIHHCGAIPRFIDIDPNTYNIDSTRIEPAINSRTRAILVVHQMGLPANLTSILEIANLHNLPVIEDAACALGSEIFIHGEWQRIGRPHGKMACFSFHPRKILTTGEGGMITTNDKELDSRLRLLRQHGMSVSDLQRHSATQIVFEEYLTLGFNYRMSDIQAAIGRAQLENFIDRLAIRRSIAKRYTAAIRKIPGLLAPHEPLNSRWNYQSYPVRVEKDYRRTRDQLMQLLLDNGISTRRGIMNAHQEPAYGNNRSNSLVSSEVARDEVILLPIYDTLSESDQSKIICLLSE